MASSTGQLKKLVLIGFLFSSKFNPQDFLIVNTRDKDIGTIWEAGYAYAKNVPIVYFCQGLPEGAKFNLMLARSGIKVCTTFEQLEDYLDRVHSTGYLIEEPYDQEIE